jgi:hypothetical protein
MSVVAHEELDVRAARVDTEHRRLPVRSRFADKQARSTEMLRTGIADDRSAGGTKH